VAAVIARSATACGTDAKLVAGDLVERLRDGRERLRLVVVFADWRLDAAVLARELQRGFGTTPTIGCTASGVIGAQVSDAAPAAVALGLYGDWVRVGIGVAAELSKSPIVRSRDAIERAAAALGKRTQALDPARHVAFTLFDGTSGHEDAFCIGSAAAAPQIRFVGGAASTEIDPNLRASIWANGDALSDAGLVVVLETERRFEAITSQHLVATDVKTVVTAASARTIDELDGVPAARRLRELLERIEETIDPARPAGMSFARFVDGVAYVRSITKIDGDRIQLASAVEPGHVLRLMRPGDLIERTRVDLAAAAQRIGDTQALIAFSCLGRHWEATARGIDAQLAGVYAEFPTVGFQSFGEQTGMLLVNHTLTALAIGET
jgi:hypothetical protein